MLTLKALLWISSALSVTSKFTCPGMKSFCACSDGTDWWLDQWTNVRVVNCSHRGLTRIPDLSSLRGQPFHRLLLDNNNISEIDKETFTNISVKEVVLKRNPMKRIPDDAFHEIREVIEILDLDSARIKINKGLNFLQGMYNLKALDMGYNRLTDKYEIFPSGLFADLNLTSLSLLTLQALQMTGLEDGAFTGIENLEQLDLSYNFLSEFPTELLKLKNLRGLKLYSNELMTLKNNSFVGLTKLRKLLVGVNEITADSIELGAFADFSDSIEEINFYQNPLYRVPSSVLQNLKQLKRLSLPKTSLSTIENGSFVGEYKLKELHLDDNPRLKFDDEGMFTGIEDSLEVLFIRTLNLEKLPLKVLRRLENLYYLDATDNAIAKIDRNFFDGLTKLSQIKLMWNKITYIDPKAFENLEKGVILNLHNNDLTDISFILNVEECTFQELYVTSNRIPCDCTVEKVLNSGLVSWQILGDCYIKSETETKWYSFSDPNLMTHFRKVCTVTKPYASCIQSVSGGTVKMYLQISVMFVSIYVYIVVMMI